MDSPNTRNHTNISDRLMGLLWQECSGYLSGKKEDYARHSHPGGFIIIGRVNVKNFNLLPRLAALFALKQWMVGKYPPVWAQIGDWRCPPCKRRSAHYRGQCDGQACYQEGAKGETYGLHPGC